MKKYSKKSDLTPILHLAGSNDVDPRFYLEERLSAILPPNVQNPISTMRILDKLSSSALGSSEIISMFSLPIKQDEKPEIKSRGNKHQPDFKAKTITPQLLMNPKKKKSLKEHSFQ